MFTVDGPTAKFAYETNIGGVGTMAVFKVDLNGRVFFLDKGLLPRAGGNYQFPS